MDRGSLLSLCVGLIFDQSLQWAPSLMDCLATLLADKQNDGYDEPSAKVSVLTDEEFSQAHYSEIIYCENCKVARPVPSGRGDGTGSIPEICSRIHQQGRCVGVRWEEREPRGEDSMK